MSKKEKLTKANYSELVASILGACFIAFGAGILFADYLKLFSLPLILLGLFLHSWGMYRMHLRNR
jgi:hypothetical protein